MQTNSQDTTGWKSTWQALGLGVASLLIACAAMGCSGQSSPPSASAAPTQAQPRDTSPGVAPVSSPTNPPSNNATQETPAVTTNASGASNPSTPQTAQEVAMFGGGCFWGVEHIFEQEIDGVIDAVSGYTGGRIDNPTYKQVSYEDTGHVEVVQITFDPKKVSYEQLVNYFYRMIDPTQVNGQGPDLGDQYRSVIYYLNDEQKRIAEKVRIERQPKHKRKIAVVEEPAQKFWKAEDYHQDYYIKTGKQPYCHVLRPD